MRWHSSREACFYIKRSYSYRLYKVRTLCNTLRRDLMKMSTLSLFLILFGILSVCGVTMNVESYKSEEIKEYHFHVYFFQTNEVSKNAALKLRDRLLDLTKKKFFHVVPLERVNMAPIGPHPIGSYEVWCPREHFSRVYSWFLLHHGELSILVHPLTKEEVKDHTDRATWIGKSLPLDISRLSPMLPQVPKQYPELGLGYSAP